MRTAREAQKIGVRALAKRVGVSASLISQVERGKVMPSVGTLYAVVRELDISMDDLFATNGVDAQAEPEGEGPVLRNDRRKTIYLASGVRWERLTLEPDPDLDFQLATYDIGAESCPPDALMTHGGREYGYVLSGRLEVTIADETFSLGSGDSISFSSTEPHRLANAGSEPAETIWLVTSRDRDARLIG
jgi:transcriptional regulator with XRE-family HTH domain